MSKINLDEIDATYYDILRELGNIGAGNATTALSTMLNRKIDMSVPQVGLLPFANLTDMIGSEETLLVGILLQIEGDIDGMIMFLMHEESAHHIVNALMGTQNEVVGAFNEMELSALHEIGNIITGAYLSSLAALTNMKILASVPSMSIDMAGALLSVPAIEFGKIGDKVLLIQTKFGEDDFMNGYFLLIPELESYDKILSSLGM